MAFTWFADKPLHTRADVGRALLAVADELNMPDKKGAFICGAMCMFQEAGGDPHRSGQRQIWTPGNHNDPAFHADPERFPHDSMGDDGASVGPFQQQAGRHWGWGGNLGDPEGTRKRMDLYESIRLFFGHTPSGLKAKGYDASNARAAGDSIQAVQGSDFPRAYDQWWNEAHALYAEATGDHAPPPPAPAPPSALPANPYPSGWRGDPTWMPEVLRLEGLTVEVLDVAMIDGHGDFGDIWGVVWHHTGGYGDTPRSLSNGSASLAGPVCNLFIRPDGVVWVIAVGVAWHAGYGVYPGIREDGANQVTIGIECLHNGVDPWPAAQYDAMVKTGAALTRFMKYTAERNIAHKEWAGADNPLGINKQGKWDPGNFDMGRFRADIQTRIATFTPGITDPAADLMGELLDMATQEEKDLLLAAARRIMSDDWSLVVEAARKMLGIWSPAQQANTSKRGWASRSIYRDPRAPESVVDDTVGMVLFSDAHGHEERVEAYALLGVPAYIEVVRETAEGRGAVTTTDAVTRAQAVLNKVQQSQV